MGYARRWLMKGPWKHPNGVWYYRGELPKDIWDARDQIRLTGVPLPRGKEIRRSLNTRDRKIAALRHAEVITELEGHWNALRVLLRDGPARLSERNVVAIAGERSRRFIKAHEENPSVGAAQPARPSVSLPDDVVDAIGKLSPEDEAKLNSALTTALERPDSGDALGSLLEEWGRDPVLSIISRSILEPVRATLVNEHAAALRRLLRERGEIVDRQTWASLLISAAQFQKKARESLGRMATHGDFREPDWINGLPDYRPSTPSHSFDAVIDAEAKRRSAGKDARPLPPKTIVSFKAICRRFAEFRGVGGSNAATVTENELERWKSSLIESGEVGNRTVANRLTTIKTVIGWGRGQSRTEFARAASAVAEVRLPDFTPKPSDLSAIHPDEAVIILRAAREETDPRLQWLPWICAYTGLRIAEACQLRTTDFFESEGHWFFEVSSSGKRSLKTANARRVIPVHRALIREGLRHYVEGLPEGPLFRRGASVAVNRWFHKIDGIHEGVSPNHGWRHLFKDLCRRYGLNDDARHYLTGHSTGGADQAYGRTRAMLPGLWRQLESIKPFRL